MQDGYKRSRAMKGADAAAVSPKRFAPLRKVVEEDDVISKLECGHEISTPHDLIGRTYAERRRCLICLAEDCNSKLHPLDIIRGTSPSCKCGWADGLVSHLWSYHVRPGASIGTVDEMQRWFREESDLEEAVQAVVLHKGLHLSGVVEREHYHWSSLKPWEVRTRPES